MHPDTDDRFNVPVAVIFFNRPDRLHKVMAEVAKLRPQQLFLIADGPREGNEQDSKRSQEAREAALASVNWPCELKTHFNDTNLGCGKRPATGISWLFKQVDRAIILEDDCVPDPSFFQFCEELLEYYETDKNVYSICGINHGITSPAHSYYFSKVPLIGAWATWSNRWADFDFNLDHCNTEDIDRSIKPWISNPRLQLHLKRVYERIKNGTFTTCWDFQWLLACLRKHAIAIIPNTNLIQNIGFGSDATHSDGDESDEFFQRKAAEIQFPLSHPNKLSIDEKLQDRLYRKVYPIQNRPLKKIKKKLVYFLRKAGVYDSYLRKLLFWK